jgi:hypothetical protein
MTAAIDSTLQTKQKIKTPGSHTGSFYFAAIGPGLPPGRFLHLFRPSFHPVTIKQRYSGGIVAG